MRAEIVEQFQTAFPEYRLLKVVPALSKARPRRRQTIRNVPSGTLIGTTERSAASTDPRPPPKLGNPALSDDERT